VCLTNGIAEWGVQNAQCSPLLPPSDAQCPLNHTRSPPCHQIAAAEVESCDHGPTPQPTGITHWFLSVVTQHLAAYNVQYHCYSLTSHEWPLWLAAAAHASCLCHCLSGPPLYRLAGCIQQSKPFQWLDSCAQNYNSGWMTTLWTLRVSCDRTTSWTLDVLHWKWHWTGVTGRNMELILSSIVTDWWWVIILTWCIRYTICQCHHN